MEAITKAPIYGLFFLYISEPLFHIDREQPQSAAVGNELLKHQNETENLTEN